MIIARVLGAVACAVVGAYWFSGSDDDNKRDDDNKHDRSQPQETQNYHQYDDDSIKANLLPPSPASDDENNRGDDNKRDDDDDDDDDSVLGTYLFSGSDDDNKRDCSQTNRKATQKRQNHHDQYDRSQPNRKAPSPAPELRARSNGVSPPTKKSASLNNNLEGKPTGPPAGQITPFEQSDVKLNISTSSFPSKKPVPSSSPQRPGAVSFVQSDTKSNTSTSSFSTKTVQSSSPLWRDATSFPNNFITKPATCSCMQCIVKSNSPKNSQASKPIPAVSPEPKAASSPIYSKGGLICTGPPTKGGFICKPPFEQSDVKLNISTSSFPSKPVSSSSPQRPGTVSFVQSDVQSNTSNSSQNSQASKPIPAVSPEPKAASSPIYSTRQTTTSPFVKSGPGPSEIEDPKEVGKGGTQRYEIPKHIEEMIKNNIVPPVLKMPLSPDTYADYFAALLYAEDFYCEKWSDYLLEDVTLKLQNQSDNKKSKKCSDSKTKTKKNYPLVVFEINKVPERRPFLLSRDHVHLRPVDKGRDFEPFRGVLISVVKGTTVLAEFKDDFHIQHAPSKRYDVSFSFNRVCLKRAHRAVSLAANPLLSKILFPKPTSLPTQWGQVSPIDQILNHKLAPIPYLIEGPSSTVTSLIKDVVLKIYKSRKENRVLICAQQNSTCDELVRLIMEKVCEYDIFRANAAFRDKEEVPGDIMPSCIFRRERFTCPPLDELEHFRIITSTFVSTFRLYNAGLKAGHFSHIFLLDASSAIEPEMIVALVDLVSEETVVVVTGLAEDKPRWVRSDTGRNRGLRKSFFERLHESEPYRSDNPLLITHI